MLVSQLLQLGSTNYNGEQSRHRHARRGRTEGTKNTKPITGDEWDARARSRRFRKRCFYSPTRFRRRGIDLSTARDGNAAGRRDAIRSAGDDGNTRAVFRSAAWLGTSCLDCHLFRPLMPLLATFCRLHCLSHRCRYCYYLSPSCRSFVSTIDSDGRIR